MFRRVDGTLPPNSHTHETLTSFRRSFSVKTVRLTLVFLTILASAAAVGAQTPAAPATTDVYHVMFVKAAPGQAAALAKDLQQPDPKNPMASGLLPDSTRRHEGIGRNPRGATCRGSCADCVARGYLRLRSLVARVPAGDGARRKSDRQSGIRGQRTAGGPRTSPAAPGRAEPAGVQSQGCADRHVDARGRRSMAVRVRYSIRLMAGVRG